MILSGCLLCVVALGFRGVGLAWSRVEVFFEIWKAYHGFDPSVVSDVS